MREQCSKIGFDLVLLQNVAPPPPPPPPRGVDVQLKAFSGQPPVFTSQPPL